MLILASGSPRRRELLETITKEFVVIVSGAEEDAEGLSPREAVVALAVRKAEEVASTHPDDVVIGADTLVALNGIVYGKPGTAQEAKRMLSALSGKTHEVCTGVCVVKGGKRFVAVESSFVTIELTNEQIDRYVEGGSPLDKAGAYGIQDGVVASYEGSYTNIVGFPVDTVRRLLTEAEVSL